MTLLRPTCSLLCLAGLLLAAATHGNGAVWFLIVPGIFGLILAAYEHP